MKRRLSVSMHGRNHHDYADDTDLGPNAVEHLPSEETANEFLGRLESLLRSASNELEPPATLGEYEAQVAALQLECDDPLTFPNVGWEVLDAFDELPRAQPRRQAPRQPAIEGRKSNLLSACPHRRRMPGPSGSRQSPPSVCR